VEPVKEVDTEELEEGLAEGLGVVGTAGLKLG